jgi:hypothetical protein
LYGLFPGFVPHVRQQDVEAAISRINEVTKQTVSGIVATIPADWEVKKGARDALIELICRRAEFVAENFPSQISKLAWPGQLFDNDK